MYPLSLNFNPFCSTASQFSNNTGHFETRAPTDPVYILLVPLVVTLVVTLLNPCHPTASRFRVTGHLETRPPNGPKNDTEN